MRVRETEPFQMVAIMPVTNTITVALSHIRGAEAEKSQIQIDLCTAFNKRQF